jgi:hypothetical protein
MEGLCTWTIDVAAVPPPYTSTVAIKVAFDVDIDNDRVEDFERKADNALLDYMAQNATRSFQFREKPQQTDSEPSDETPTSPSD